MIRDLLRATAAALLALACRYAGAGADDRRRRLEDAGGRRGRSPPIVWPGARRGRKVQRSPPSTWPPS